MRKNIFPIIILVFIVVAFWAGSSYYDSARRVDPNPTEVGTQTAPSTDTSPGTSTMTPAPTSNTTGLSLKLPDGFGISIYARNLDAPRVLQVDPNGRLLVSVPNAGTIVRLIDANNDGVAERTETLLSRLTKPHGFWVDKRAGSCANEQCRLFVAEEDKVSVYVFDSQGNTVQLKKKLADLPRGGNHVTRSLYYEPSTDLLLVAIGSSCNVCNEEDNRRAAIIAMNSNGDNQRMYATGLRNTVFMTKGPDGKVYGTDMGRDHLGDNLPPEEVNIIEEGKNYGWPICYGNNIHDTNFDKNTYVQNPCNDKVAPIAEMQAHSAPLGLVFIPGSGWPSAYRGDLIVAFHGSWNRTVPTGYKLVRVRLDNQGKYEGIEDFITGWHDGKTTHGRPVDVLITSDNNMYVTDDKTGYVYRIAPPR